MRIRSLVFVCALLAGIVCTQTAFATPDPFLEAPATRPLILRRAVITLKDGQVWGHWGNSLYCDILPAELRWKSGDIELDNPRFSSVFGAEVAKAGYRDGEPQNLFEDRAVAGSLQVGAVIKDIQARVCSSSADGTERTRSYRGWIDMTVEWQIFDPTRREVVARLQTVARGEQRVRERDGLATIIIEAFRQNARSLMNNESLRQLTAIAADPQTPRSFDGKSPILLAGALSPGPRSLPDAAGSVVLVLTDDGHGSGFLVSREGYLLTNQHVVGGAKTVRIRWSDGYEISGEVVRTDKRRDVALIKTSAHSRQPLPLRPELARMGEPVLAIGTPLDLQFQGTLTKGVVSSTRIFEGLSFIQSDVVVNPGNSGGPLLDEKGQVIGITALAYRPEGLPTGINLFIPIGDALDFLSLKVTP